MSKRRKKMTMKQLRSLVAFLITINIVLVICILVLGFFLAKAHINQRKEKTVMLKRANDTYTVCVDAGHGGSDVDMMRDFVSLIAQGGNGNNKSSADASVESHLMALAAEESRLNNGKPVFIASFREAS